MDACRDGRGDGMAAPIPFLEPRDVYERIEATAESDIDAFMMDWQTPELRQTHDVQDWCANPQHIDLQPQLSTLHQVYRPEYSVLDVGCYAGYVYDWLKPKPRHYLGVDILPEAIDAARQLHPGVDFKVGDIFALEDRADLVFCSRVLIHIPYFERAVESLCRAANQWVVLILALGSKDSCDRIHGDYDTYYFRRFSRETVHKVCGQFGKTTIDPYKTYAAVTIKIG
jgi:SAM-dependent methyltransferase